ncbi:MAG: NAD-dependent epimerase/dehydratase family protein [candidate division WOR-3 bacterium]|jgi:nucleoside-diphosphate-sugar epimerase
MKVLVTGASGFIGSHLCAYLIAQGYQVRAMVRKTSSRQWLEGLELELVYADLSDEGSLAQAVEGVDGVMHTAAVVRAGSRDELRRINYEGSERLARVSAAAGVKSFVLFSSVAAVGPVRATERLDGSRTPSPVSDYGRAKLAAEKAVLEFRDRMKVVILRLPAVYGPRDRDGLMLWQTLNRGWAPLIGGLFSLVFVSDAVRAAVLALEKPVPSGAIYFISDGNCYNYEAVAREWERITGRRVRRIKVPFLAGLIFARIYSWLKREGTIFNPDKIRELYGECWVCADPRAKEDLGFEPEFDLCRGGEITLRWYKEQGWI